MPRKLKNKKSSKTISAVKKLRSALTTHSVRQKERRQETEEAGHAFENQRWKESRCFSGRQLCYTERQRNHRNPRLLDIAPDQR